MVVRVGFEIPLLLFYSLTGHMLDIPPVSQPASHSHWFELCHFCFSKENIYLSLSYLKPLFEHRSIGAYQWEPRTYNSSSIYRNYHWDDLTRNNIIRDNRPSGSLTSRTFWSTSSQSVCLSIVLSRVNMPVISLAGMWDIIFLLFYKFCVGTIEKVGQMQMKCCKY